MKQYLDLARDILDNGKERPDRTGTGVLSLFSRSLRFDLQEGFPLVTTKKVSFRNIVFENLWFLRGDTNIKFLTDNGVHIWDKWAMKDGEIGPMYGKQMVKWRGGGNQIANLIYEIRTNPYSRRHVISTWNVADIPESTYSPQQNVTLGYMALAPCHGVATQFYVDEGKLSCLTFTRSSDVPIGLPYNIAGYALLTHMIAHQCDLEVDELIYHLGDCHIYKDQIDGIREQLIREPLPIPSLSFARKPDSIFDYQYEDFILENYQHHEAIKMPVSV